MVGCIRRIQKYKLKEFKSTGTWTTCRYFPNYYFFAIFNSPFFSRYFNLLCVEKINQRALSLSLSLSLSLYIYIYIYIYIYL